MSVFSLKAYAQRYEIGINGTATGYMGDLNNVDPFYFKQYGGGIFVKRNIDTTWSIKMSAHHMLISGNDLDFKNNFQQERRLKFLNQLSELAFMLDFNFWRNNRRNASKLSPYITAGLAMIKHDPYIYYDQNKIKLRPLKLEYEEGIHTKEFKTWNMAIPMGLGLKYKVNPTWALGMEATYRLAFTDYLDNVSQYYPTSFPTEVTLLNIKVNGPNGQRPFDVNDWYYLAYPSRNITTKAGSARGDGNSKDGYMTAGIPLTYTLLDRNCFRR